MNRSMQSVIRRCKVKDCLAPPPCPAPRVRTSAALANNKRGMSHFNDLAIIGESEKTSIQGTGSDRQHRKE
jgi:hypothetical protein